MLSDAPAHHLFCLLPPVPPTQNALPEVLAVLQVTAKHCVELLQSLSQKGGCCFLCTGGKFYVAHSNAVLGTWSLWATRTFLYRVFSNNKLLCAILVGLSGGGNFTSIGHEQSFSGEESFWGSHPLDSVGAGMYPSLPFYMYTLGLSRY